MNYRLAYRVRRLRYFTQQQAPPGQASQVQTPVWQQSQRQQQTLWQQLPAQAGSVLIAGPAVKEAKIVARKRMVEYIENLRVEKWQTQNPNRKAVGKARERNAGPERH